MFEVNAFERDEVEIAGLALVSWIALVGGK